jgi:hypothetical protein
MTNTKTQIEHCSEINCPACQRALLDKTLIEIREKIERLDRGTLFLDGNIYILKDKIINLLKDIENK